MLTHSQGLSSEHDARTQSYPTGRLLSNSLIHTDKGFISWA